jgi:uncharacterized phage infection (PIP) family protein YhgE
MGLFGPDKEKQKMAENMASLSEQIAKLQQQMNDKNSQISSLQEDLSSAQLDASGKATEAKGQVSQLQSALAVAEADRQAASLQIGDLQQQIAMLQKQLAEDAAEEAEQAPTSGLKAGMTAYVTREGGMALRLRNGPGLNHGVVGSMPPGTSMTLLAGPTHEDGYSWWNVRTSDGTEGWCAGNDLRQQPD